MGALIARILLAVKFCKPWDCLAFHYGAHAQRGIGKRRGLRGLRR